MANENEITIELVEQPDYIINLEKQGPAGLRGPVGPQGAQGNKGDKGEQGIQGIQGPSGTITLGTVETGLPGTDVIITNTGNEENAVFNFTIPRGDVGPEGGTAFGIKGDYATHYGIEYCQYGLIENPVGTKDIAVKGGMMLCVPGVDTKTTIGSDINYTIESSEDVTIFYAEGSILEVLESEVYYSTEEPIVTTTGYTAWWNPQVGTWKFISADTGNIWREANATPLADIKIADDNVTRIDYIGYRLLNDDIYAIKEDVDSNIEELDSRIDNLDNEYANINLSNLTSTGEKHFLNKSQITNCITEIPQNIKMELNNGTLTLKAGSKVIVPNGAGVFEEAILSTDFTVSNGGASGSKFFFWRPEENGWYGIVQSNCHSGPTQPTSGQLWYNTSDNKIYVDINQTGTWTVKKVSFPLGIYTSVNGSIASIDQIFNSFGCIGNTIFCDKGVKGLIPNGRNQDGSLKNIEFVTSKVLVQTRNLGGSGNLVIGSTAFSNYAVANYDDNTNFVYASNGNKVAYSTVGTWSADSTGKITSFQPKLPVHLVDWNDLDNYIKGMPVGTVFSHTCSASFVPENSLPCNGSEYTQAQFPNLYNDWLVGGKLKTCTYTEYSNMLTTYGQCPMWALDTTNKKFRVPTIKDGAVIQQAMSNNELGKAYNAGLPNITGSIGMGESYYTSGAFYKGTEQSGNTKTDGASDPSANFDASRSNPIYGNSDTVQMNAVALRYFVVVATGTINQSVMDWSQWASSLNGKLNADHSNDTKPYITETYVNGTSWRIVYSNKWCEQGGRTSTGGSATVTLLTPYKDTNYTLTLGHISTSTGSGPTDASPLIRGNISNTGFTIYQYSSNALTCWRTAGYIA